MVVNCSTSLLSLGWDVSTGYFQKKPTIKKNYQCTTL